MYLYMQLSATSTPLGEDFWIFFDLQEFGRFGAFEGIFGCQSQIVGSKKHAPERPCQADLLSGVVPAQLSDKPEELRTSVRHADAANNLIRALASIGFVARSQSDTP